MRTLLEILSETHFPSPLATHLLHGKFHETDMK
jgi:hypothetical protein